MIKANNPSLQSWLKVPRNSDFPIQNIPFGIFKPKNPTSPRAGTRIGNHVIDLAAIAEKGYFTDAGISNKEVFAQPVLNDFIALGRPVWQAVRDKISDMFDKQNEEIWNTEDFKEDILHDIKEVEMLLPVHVTDYTDFYSSLEHATNVGTMFRDPDNALLPNWRHLPVGYHGRASSIVVSGTDIHRPIGQTKGNDDAAPVLEATRQLDFELEMAFVVGKSTALGDRIPLAQAKEHIFGLVLFDDLSARDIQKWEYVPLGPFLAKNFGSVVSAWVVTLDALEPFRVDGPKQEPAVLPYLQFAGAMNYDVQLEVLIETRNFPAQSVCQSNFKYMYWNIFQQLAHHTINGCNISVGDMYASGTLSGPQPEQFGSMLELTWRGTKPLTMPDGTQRKFINDNDTVILRAHAEKDGVRIGFGESRTTILPAKPL
jgi:fumarylacetoacetase